MTIELGSQFWYWWWWWLPEESYDDDGDDGDDGDDDDGDGNDDAAAGVAVGDADESIVQITMIMTWPVLVLTQMMVMMMRSKALEV